MIPSLSQPPPPNNTQRFFAWCDAHQVGARWEKFHPALLGLLSFCITLLIDVTPARFQKLMSDVAPSAIAVAAILAGFQGTIQAILLSMQRSRVVTHLRKRGTYDTLVQYVRWGFWSLMGFVALAMMFVFLFALQLPPTRYRLIGATLVGTFVFAMLASLRIMLLIVRMLHIED